MVDVWKAFEGAVQIEGLRIRDYECRNISAKEMLSGLAAIKERLYEVQRTAQESGDEMLSNMAKEEKEKISSKIGEIVVGFSRVDSVLGKRDKVQLPARRN